MKINEKSFRIKSVVSPFCFQLDGFFEQGVYERNGYVEEVKVPCKGVYRTLREVFESPQSSMIDCEMDYTNLDKVHVLKSVLHTLWDAKAERLFDNDLDFSSKLERRVREDYRQYLKYSKADHSDEQEQQWL